MMAPTHEGIVGLKGYFWYLKENVRENAFVEKFLTLGVSFVKFTNVILEILKCHFKILNK